MFKPYQLSKSKFFAFSFIIALAGILLILCSCSSPSGSNTGQLGDIYNTGSGEVAATVNNQDITEDAVTEYIEDFRELNHFQDDVSWAQYLSQNKFTPEGIRNDSINYLAKKATLDRLASENNVVISDDQIQSQYDQIRQEYYAGYDDEQWQKTLSNVGYREDTYKDFIKECLIKEALIPVFATDIQATEADALSLANEYSDSLEGSSKISVIAFDNEEQAQEVYNQITSGEISFEDAKAQYDPEDIYDAWDCLVDIDPVVKSNASSLEVEGISGVISSNGQYYIVKVVDRFFTPQEGLNRENLPDEIFQVFMDSANEKAKYNYVEEFVEAETAATPIDIRDMPEGLSYDVDLSLADTANVSEGAEGEDAGESEDVPQIVPDENANLPTP